MSFGDQKGKGRYNVVVIGAGTAGLVTAAGTAGLGGRVALIEQHKMGGDCLNTGCVPSKALIRSAKILQYLRRATDFGLQPMAADFSPEDVFARMRRRRALIEPNDSQERFEGLGVDVFRGRARFVSPHAVVVDGQELRARHFVVATGSSPLVPRVPGIDQVPYYTNESFFDELTVVPRSMIVLGGGPIGCELAQVMRRLGLAVTLVELLPRLLPRDDAEAAARVEARLRQEGVTVLTGTEATRFAHTAGKVHAEVQTPGGPGRLVADILLVAAGRKANVSDLGLEAAGIDHTPRGIVVDRTLATSQPHIFACGDVAGPLQFTHSADYQSRIVVRNILIPWYKAKASYDWVPWVTFTDPEVGQVGLTEHEALSRGVAYRSFRLDWSDLDRAVTDSETEGFIKVLTPPGSDKLLGATVVGTHAGEVLHELALAGRHKLGLSQVSATIHAYPTLSQSVQRVADLYMRSRLTPRVARVFKWLYRRRRA